MESRTGTARSGDPNCPIDIYYEDLGDLNAPPVLLIMGLGAQLILWKDGFCRKLVDQGYRVIRYDNRDVGLSSKLDGQRERSPLPLRMLRSLAGLRSPAAYTLEDMADDTAAVLDHLDVDSAHIVGGSMGGMLAQVFAARHHDRTKTLAVIFSSNNQPFLPPPGPRQLLSVITGPAPDASRDVVVDNAVKVGQLNASPAYPTPQEQLRADAIAAYERSHYPAGIARHFDAILGSGSLRHHDRRVTAPTVVIHGGADKLMRPFGGKAIARAIPGARFVLIDGMGHELPEGVWDRVIGELKTTFAERP